MLRQTEIGVFEVLKNFKYFVESLFGMSKREIELKK